MDLSKAFDALHDDLLVVKIPAYDFREELLKLYSIVSLTDDKE